MGFIPGRVAGAISLQRVLGLADDGQIGPVTLAATKKANPGTTMNAICDERMAFLRALKVFKKFEAGLTNRVDRCRKAALSMI